MAKQYTITDSLKKAYEILIKNQKLFILSIIASILNIIINLGNVWLMIIGFITSMIYGLFMTIMISLSTERALKKRKIDLKKAYEKSKKIVIPLLLVQLLYILIVAGGLVLLIIPGIIFAFVLWPAPLVAIFEDTTITGAIKRAWSIGKQNFGLTFKLLILDLLVGLLIWAIGSPIIISAGYVPYMIINAVISVFTIPYLIIFTAVIYLKALKK